MINLMVAGNDRVFDGLITLSLSLIKHCTRPIKLYIFTMDFTEHNPKFTPITQLQADFIKDILVKGNAQSEVCLCDVSSPFKEKFLPSVNIDTKYTPYTLLRLLADDIIKEEKVAYIDIDILAKNDISLLFDTDISEYELGVVEDKMGKFWIHKGYFNAGMLLINLDMVRKTGLFKKAIDLVKNKKMAFPDQDALNRTVTKKLLLPSRFNSQGVQDDQTVLMHFCKTIRWLPFFKIVNVKPWQVDDVRKLHDMSPFDDILNQFISIKNSMEKKENE